jgi:hypothetical protein
MSLLKKNSKLILVAVCCLALGAGASAIATAGAAPTAAAAPRAMSHGWRLAKLKRLTRSAVHGQVVVATRRGFVTVSFDRGRVASVAGRQLTLTEGRPGTTTAKNVTLTIPTTARVRDDHQRTTLSALQPGQRVMVIRTPRRTLVIAHTPKG